jgi:hypothetical protein
VNSRSSLKSPKNHLPAIVFRWTVALQPTAEGNHALRKEKKMKMQVRLALIAPSMLVTALLPRAVAQVALPDIFVQVTSAGLGYPGETVSFCFSTVRVSYNSQNQTETDVGYSLDKQKPGVATLQIINADTHSKVAEKDVTLPPPGSPELPSDPCVQYNIPLAVTSSSLICASCPPASSASAYIGLVSVSSEPVPPTTGSAEVSSEPVPPVSVVSSLEIFTLGTNGFPQNVRHISSSSTCPSLQGPCLY